MLFGSTVHASRWKHIEKYLTWIFAKSIFENPCYMYDKIYPWESGVGNKQATCAHIKSIRFIKRYQYFSTGSTESTTKIDCSLTAFSLSPRARHSSPPFFATSVTGSPGWSCLILSLFFFIHKKYALGGRLGAFGSFLPLFLSFLSFLLFSPFSRFLP